MFFGPSGASVAEVSSPVLVVRTLLSPHPRRGLGWAAVLVRTVSSDKQFHPRLRKLKGKLWTKQIILLKPSVATNCDEEEFISNFTTASNQKLAVAAGGQRRRRRDVSRFWWLSWSLRTNVCLLWQQAFCLSILQCLVCAYPWCTYGCQGAHLAVFLSRWQD